MARANPEDAGAFAPKHLDALCAATHELSWLLGRGYADTAALKLVGDKHQLTGRQRMAVRRCACTDDERTRRQAHRVEGVGGCSVAVDGFNQLVTTERGLAGGAVLRGRDGALRDVASVHGTWRRSERTAEALDRLCVQLQGAADVLWILDAQVSNSGRLAGMIRDRGDWPVRLESNADAALLETGGVLATSDAMLLDRCDGWFALAEGALAAAGVQPIDLTAPGTTPPCT